VLDTKSPKHLEMAQGHISLSPSYEEVAAREDGLTNMLYPSLANACKPLLQAHLPWAQDNTSRGSLFPPCVPSRVDPSGLGHTAAIYSSVQGPPPGSKRRQLARQVGACCVLTNSFPSSSRWVVSSNLSSPGRCSISGVSSSCPSTAATTWTSFLRRATMTTTAVSPPDGGGIDDVFPHGGRAASGPIPSPSPLQEEEAGQPWPSRRRHLVGCRASR
jgi:hypothetical protein